METDVIPVIIMTTGNISKSYSIKHLSNVPGTSKIKEIQKTVILGTAHVLWKVIK
jgi:hypothetical protein